MLLGSSSGAPTQKKTVARRIIVLAQEFEEEEDSLFSSPACTFSEGFADVQEESQHRDATPKPKENGSFTPYLGTSFNPHHDLRADVSKETLLKSWTSCECLKGVPPVKGNSIVNPNLGVPPVGGRLPPR